MTSTFNRRAMLGAAGAGLAGAALAPVTGHAQNAKAPTTPMPSIETFARTPLVDKIALSPDGNRVAVISQDMDEKILLYFDIINKAPKFIKIDNIKPREIYWIDNDKVMIVFSRTIQKSIYFLYTHEALNGYVYELATGKKKVIEANLEYSMGLARSPQKIKLNGAYAVTLSGYDRDGIIHLACVTSDGTHLTQLSNGGSNTEGWVVDPEGYPVARSEFSEFSKHWSLLFNTAPPQKLGTFKTVYKVHTEIDRPDLLGLGRDGKSVLVRFSDGDMAGQYREIASDGTIGEPLDPDGEGRPRSALFHPVTGRLAGFLRHDDWFTYDYFDPLLKKLTEALPALLGEDYRNSIADFAEDPRKMIAYSEGADDAGSYYFIDMSNGTSANIAVNYPDLPKEWITQKQIIQYKAADGLEIHGYLTLPPFKDAKNLPLVVLPHGGPQARDYIDFDWQVQTLASRGYAVLQPNFRGSSGYTDDFVSAGHGEWGRKMQTDLSDGVRYLADKGIVDAKRVAIFGASYGGYAALAGATLDPGIYTCAVAIAAPSDLKGMIAYEAQMQGSSHASVVLYWKEFMGDPAQYDDISPAKQAAKAYCPILLIHGTDDTVVPIDQSQRMEKALKDAGKNVEFITYQGQDHWETIASARVTMMQAAVDFLMKHNPA